MTRSTISDNNSAAPKAADTQDGPRETPLNEGPRGAGITPAQEEKKPARPKDRRAVLKERLFGAACVLFWLCVWQLLSVIIDQEILLVSPILAVRTLWELMGTRAFYLSVAGSFGRILLGFALALLLGTALAALCSVSRVARALFNPLMSAIKATPVASFVILALVWISARNLSVFTSFLMVLPVVYTNVLKGLRSADESLIEMARVFGVGVRRRIGAIYAPAALPYFLAACQLSLGICWKAGIAAEVIGQPSNSIGDALYRAKLFLSTDELFAWTLAIIALSVLFEKLALLGIGALQRAWEGR